MTRARAQRLVLFALWLTELGASGCGESNDKRHEEMARQAAALEQSGVFSGGVVGGLSYATASTSGTTDESGRFVYRPGEAITFSIGELEIGSARAGASLTAMDLVPGASDASNPRVNNLLVLLQTLDQDGDLNNGIAITAEIAAIVSKYKTELSFERSTADFADDPHVLRLVNELNEAALFTDTDPRARKLRGAAAAREYFVRAVARRKVVETQYGKVSGYAANESTWQWLGIPYAKPPLGALRWKPPAEPEPWSATRDAVAWADQAPQDPRFEASGEGGMSEDCLYLNVTAPENARDLPVMVWFHGGAFTILTGNSRSYNNIDSLTTKGVVLVTVNHRLGPFGYINHPWLVDDSSYGGSGNYGQMDLVMALEWVQRNIVHFGGDPNNVTIFGQSGGCGKVSSLMTSPMASGLFHKAACQSGTSAINSTATKYSVIASSEQVGEAFFKRLGVDSLAQARELPWTAIVQADIDANIPRETYRPSIDGYYVSKTQYDSLREGQPNDVPLLIGATSGDYPWLRSGLREVMPFRSQHSTAEIYVYKFSRVPAGWAERNILSGHGGELPYLFNFPQMFVNNYLFDLVQDQATGKRPVIDDIDGDGMSGTDGDADDILASAGWNDEDSRFADTLMTVWTNFAKTGSPKTPELDWTPYTADADNYLEFGPSTVELKTGLAEAFP